MPNWKKFSFKIEGKINGVEMTPYTIPLARLAEYLTDLAILMGHRESVHLIAVEDGSTAPVFLVDETEESRVIHRIRTAQRGMGPHDANLAYKRIDNKLREDHGIGVPTPAMAEVLVRSGANRAKYVSVLSDTWKFQILSFDSRAAIEAADLVAAIKSRKEKWDTWAKVKFDIQIVSIAKAESATLIYSDDKDIENFAKRFNIRVVRICDLPLPPVEEKETIETGPAGSQGMLALAEPKSEGSNATEAITTSLPSGATAEASNKLQADPAHPPSLQGSNRGRAQGEAAGEAEELTEQGVTLPERICALHREGKLPTPFGTVTALCRLTALADFMLLSSYNAASDAALTAGLSTSQIIALR